MCCVMLIDVTYYVSCLDCIQFLLKDLKIIETNIMVTGRDLVFVVIYK